MYRRGKREDANKPSMKNLSVSIGSINDSFESLKTMCNDKSIELLKSVDLNDGEYLDVVFWTSDIPELIGTSRIIKNKSGMLSYTLDFSLTTL